MDATPEEQAEQYNQVFRDWLMAGATKANADASLQADEGFDGFAEKLAKENADVFAQALYGPGWQNDSDHVYTAEYMTKMNAASIRMYLASSDEPEPFSYTMTTQESRLIRSNKAKTEFTVETTSLLTNNGDKNRGGTIYPEVVGRKEVSKQQITFVKKDGHIYVSSIGVMTQ